MLFSEIQSTNQNNFFFFSSRLAKIKWHLTVLPMSVWLGNQKLFEDLVSLSVGKWTVLLISAAARCHKPAEAVAAVLSVVIPRASESGDTQVK